MAIPLIKTPEFKTTIPSTGKEIFFRPFLVKEEKILFMAKQGEDNDEIINAIKKVLADCILTDDVDVQSLALFDIEYLFLQLRSKAVGEVIDLNLKHRKETDCTHVTEYPLKIDEIKVQFPEGYSNKVMVNDDIGVQLKYPNIDSMKDFENMDFEDYKTLIELMAKHVDFVYDQNEVYDQFTHQEVVEFIENLSKPMFEKLAGFFTNMPKLTHKITWKCPSCNEEETILVGGLNNFFL